MIALTPPQPKYGRFFTHVVKKSLLTLAVIIPVLQGLAQSYYPGGIGNTNLIVWLNAGNSSSVNQSAGQVTQWNDLSGHAYNFKQSTTSRQPDYNATGGPGSRPAIVFSAASLNFLSRASMSAAISYTGGVSSFATASFNASQTGAGFERIYDFGNGPSSDNIWMGRQGTQANIGYESRDGASIDQTYTTGNPIVNGTNNIYEVVQAAGSTGNTSAVVHYLAGTTMTSNGTAGSNTWVPNAIARTVDYIGRSNWTADDYFSGSMSEILFYNTHVNTTQRIILENYLSAAWGLSVNNTYYTPPGGAFYSNLVGIGYTSAADNFTADVSGSTDGLGFSSGTGATAFLHTAGYIMAAHNQQANTVNSSITISGVGSNLNKWNRSWNVQRTGGTAAGTVTLNFNFSDYSSTSPNNTYSYGLLYNGTDGSFATGANGLNAINSVTVAGNIVSIAVKASSLAAGYYTLVWSTSSLLPVVFTEFGATRQANTGQLNWTIATNDGNSYFDVQRSGDGIHFNTLATVASATSSTASGSYSYTDLNPLTGVNYYRLQMTDAAGKTTYSIISVVDFSNYTQAAWNIYTNPATGQLLITGPGTPGNATIRILNMGGQTVKVLRQPASATMEVDIAGLTKGIYIAQVSTDKTVYVQKIIKQ
ncbi:MAG TPA: T9SS type A sorting domain-containing protein [Chitinophagaceae bacterium]|jgi:hypothetical protein